MAKTPIAVPCMDMVHTDFMESMVNMHKTEECSFTVVKNTLIYIARNIIAANAIQYGFERVMWFDSDIKFPADTLEKLSAWMDKGYDFVSGLYFTRRPPIKPVIYSELHYEKTKESFDAGATNYHGYPETLTEIAAAGFGCVLTSTDLLKRVGDQFGSPFTPYDGLGEDFSFCLRAMQIGAKMYCDTSIKCGHVGYMEFNEEYYKKQGVIK